MSSTKVWQKLVLQPHAASFTPYTRSMHNAQSATYDYIVGMYQQNNTIMVSTINQRGENRIGLATSFQEICQTKKL